MGRGAIIRTVNTAERLPAVPVDIVLRTTVRIPTLPAHGANILIRSIEEARLVPAAARPLMTMRITAIPTVHG